MLSSTDWKHGSSRKKFTLRSSMTCGQLLALLLQKRRLRGQQ
jgi:hypothetical protein